MRIIIIGAGIGGLTTALALQKFGHEVRIYEQASVLGDVGAGLTLAPNSTVVFKHLGLLDALRECSEEPEFSAIRHYQTGEVLGTWEFGPSVEEQYGSPYLQIHRADLHNLLVESVQANDADAIYLDHRFVCFEQDEHGVLVRFTNGKTAHGDVLIGADGVRSEVRVQMFNPGPPKFTGHVAWRGLIPVEKLAFPPTPATGVSIGPKRILVRYYVRDRELVNIVAFARMDGWEIESWSEHADMDELLHTFDGWNDETKMLLQAIPPEQCYKWALFSREPLDSWIQGRVGLLGDAAHPMLPFLGMGAATTIEDSLVLARAFESVSDPVTALERYDAVRRPRGSFIMAESQKRVAQLQGDEPENYNDGSERNEITLGLFEYNASTVGI